MIGLCSNRLKINAVNNEILPPQSTALYDENATNYSFDPISGIGTASSTFSSLTTKTFNFIMQNQNNESMLINFNDKNLSNNLYTNINGFDYDLDMRFLNLTSPSIIFLPIIKSTDTGVNVFLNLMPIPNSINYTGTINSFSSVLTNPNLTKNDLVLLTSQTNKLENCVYRVDSIIGDTLSVIQDNKINNILTSDQAKIFIRACILEPDSERYYGLKNDTGYNWIQQTNCLKLQNCNLNLIRDKEIKNNTILRSEISPLIDIKKNQTIAISISNGGFTSGIYTIKSIDENFIYLEPVYSEKIFIHQFCWIEQDYITFKPCIWAVNPNNFDKCELYGLKKFSFFYYNVDDILNNPLLWAKQVGGSSDQILGLILYNKIINDKFITTSDSFKIGVKLPSWVSNNTVFYGLSLQTNYMCEGFI